MKKSTSIAASGPGQKRIFVIRGKRTDFPLYPASLEPLRFLPYNTDEMKFVFLGAYDPAYPRNAVIRKGLESLGDEIAGFPVNPSFKAWMRYPILLARLAANSFRSGHGFPPAF